MPRLEEQIHGPFVVNRSSNWTRHSNGLRFLFLVFWSLLTQCHEAQGYSRITFCYDTNNYEGKTKYIAHLMVRACHLKKMFFEHIYIHASIMITKPCTDKT